MGAIRLFWKSMGAVAPANEGPALMGISYQFQNVTLQSKKESVFPLLSFFDSKVLCKEVFVHIYKEV